ncbi:MAG: bifunctional precorrin-2 dehydrogenase/sirohydrochlorin ferrochelatase [Bariatricus sp.]
MRKSYFPMFVDLSEKKIVVIGAGVIAARRIRTLLAFAENIHVIAPEICEEILRLKEEQKVHCCRKRFEEQDLVEADIVFAATNDHRLNGQIVRYCNVHGIPVNTCDQKELCDFYFPSIVLKDEIVIGIGSGGTDPGKVKSVRERIEGILE